MASAPSGRATAGDIDSAWSEQGAPEPTAGADGGASEPATRREFPETLAVEPRLITDEYGVAVLEIPRMADSITTWEVRARAHTADGAFGEGTGTFRVFQDLFLNLQLPSVLTAGDIVEVPLTVMNYSATDATVEVTVPPAPWFELTTGDSYRIDVPAGGTNKAYATMKALHPGDHRILVRATADDVGDTVELPLRVEPPGIPRTRSQTIRLSGAREIDLPFPSLAPDSAEPALAAMLEAGATRRVVVTVLPDSFRRLRWAEQALANRPTGCFEQTLSVTAINLAIAQALADDDARESEAALDRAVRQLQLNYQRLLGFYNGNGLFGSFPQRFARSHDLWLAGYAAYVLKGMTPFVAVDDVLLRMIDEQFAADIGPGADTTVATLFRLWGFVRPVSGAPARDPQSFPVAVRLLIERLRNAREESFSPLQRALLLNVWAALGDREAYARTLDGLFALFPVHAEGDEIALPAYHRGLPRGATATGARGQVASEEVAGLILQALTYDESAGHELRDAILEGLSASFDGSGLLRSTFATAMSLAGIARAERLGERSSSGWLRGEFNGVAFDEVDLAATASAGRAVQLTFDAGRSNTLQLAIVEGSASLLIECSMVFPDASHFPVEDRAYDLRVTPDAQTLVLGQTARLRVEASRILDAPSATANPWWRREAREAIADARQVLVTVGVPATFHVFEDSLKAMQETGRIERYEISGREVRLYLRELSSSFAGEITVMPTAVGNVTAPVSTMFDYYNPDDAGISPALSFQVTR